jgi:iron complex outermembrane receptor protein
MHKTPSKLRGRLLLFTAFTVAGSIAGANIGRAQTDATPVVVPGNGTSTDLSSYEIQKVKIQYKKLLLREKDIPNAVSHLDQKAVQAQNPTTGSIQTLLKQAPSVVAYTQQPGQDNATLAIRGVRNDELSETLDGIPINNLLSGSGDYVQDGSVGSPVTLNEIDGVTIYPGLAAPDHQGFGTVGGTIAYTTKQPTDDRSAELEGGFGSFDTQHIGFNINTGDIGTGPDAAKALLLYDQSQTAGYVSNTPGQFHNFMLNVEKPYDNGLSKVGMVVIFNQGTALTQTLPAPTALIQAYGDKFNYPTSLGFYRQSGQDLTTILSDETYINKYAIFDGSLFYRYERSTTDDYSSASAIENGFPFNGLQYTPNVQGIGNFFGCVGPGSNFYSPGYFTYDPSNGGTQDCNDGESDEYTDNHNQIIGITPKLTLFPDPHDTIVIGGLIAKASAGGAQYIYGGDSAAENEMPGINSFAIGGGGQRTIFSGYVQDTVRLFNNKLQLTPGVKVDAAYSSNIEQVTDGIYNPAKLQNFTKIGGYYFGGSYNLPDNFILFGSAGKGSLFSPITDYSVGTTSSGLPGGTSAPTPEIVHLFEGGIRYDTPRLLLSVDYYYQNISDGFAYFENFLLNQQYYANNGGTLYRGVEGNGEYKVTPNLSVFGNFSYNETDYTQSYFAFDTLAQDQFGYAFQGTPLSNVPIWNGLVGVDYDIGPFSAYATGQYTGREYTTYDLVAYPTSGPNTNPLDGATVTNTKIQNPANFVVNLLLSYKIPVAYKGLQSLTASLNMQNLLDERYYNYTYSSENPVGGVYDPSLPGGQAYNSAFIGEPRSFMLDLVAKF